MDDALRSLSHFFQDAMDLLPSVRLFLLSLFLLVLALTVKVWNRAAKLSHLDNMSLKNVELTHPHIPSVRVIVSILGCMLLLFLVAMKTVNGFMPFDDPEHWLNVASFFIVLGAVSMLAELRWKGGRTYVFAGIFGSAIAFTLIIVQQFLLRGNVFDGVLLLVLLGLSFLLARRTMLRAWGIRIYLIAVFACAFWLFLYSLQ